ncbi:MAG: sugar ABC transporter permease [Nostoc sp. S4]|nr:sugar ABC transporter permease [Nostoc sp. S4]
MINLEKIRNREQRTAWIFLLPALLLLLLVFGYPIARAFWLSFFTENLGTKLLPIFSGFNNYIRMVGDGRFWQSFGTTIGFTISTVFLELLLGLAIALVLNKQFFGRDVVRTIAILPWALPTALIGLAWAWIFNDQFGVVNDILLQLGLIKAGINWLGDPLLAMIAIIVADVWKTTPFISVLLLAGLQSISADLYEAHMIDGATPWQSFYKVTLPLLTPQILIAVLFRFAQAFGIFDLIAVMTGGGPGGATEVVALYIYSTIMRYLDIGYGATLVICTFILLIVTVAIVSFLLRKFQINTFE